MHALCSWDRDESIARTTFISASRPETPRSLATTSNLSRFLTRQFAPLSAAFVRVWRPQHRRLRVTWRFPDRRRPTRADRVGSLEASRRRHAIPGRFGTHALHTCPWCEWRYRG